MTVYRGDELTGGRGYVLTATLTVLTYDYLCTLGREIAHVWTRPWSFGTCLFLLNRYLPFVDTIMALKLARTVTTPEICRVQSIAFISILTFGIMLSEVILMLRTYAIWNGNRLVLGILCALGFAVCAVLIAILTVGGQTYQFEPVLEYRYGCNIQAGSRLTILLYIMILFSETIIVALTIIKAIRDRPRRSSWASQVYKDGLLFYLYMLAITIANVAVSSRKTLEVEKHILSSLQRALHSIFCNRVILVILAQRDIECRRQLSGTYSLPISTTCGDTEQVLSTIIYAADSLEGSVYNNINDGTSSRDWSR